MPLFSIITPVYNNTKYLRGAVESVLSQSFSDFEYIIVDDGSTDGTSELVDELAREDSRIRVVHQDNQWIYASYNNGISIATGEYIFIVNSDDRMRAGILEYAACRVDMYNHPDVLWSKMIINKCDSDNSIIEADFLETEGIINEDIYFPDATIFRANWLSLFMDLFARNPVNFYKRELLNKHPFRNDVYGADVLLNIEIAPLVNTSVVLALSAYDYCERMNPDNPDASGLKYYEYDHDMFNEFYNRIFDMLLKWGIWDDFGKIRMSEVRIEFLYKQFQCIGNSTCKKTCVEKVQECVSYVRDSLIIECGKNVGRLGNIYSDAVGVATNMMMNEYVATGGSNNALFNLLDRVLSMRESGVESAVVLDEIESRIGGI